MFLSNRWIQNDDVQVISSRLTEVERKNSELEQRLAALMVEKDTLTEQLSTVSSREGELSVKHQVAFSNFVSRPYFLLQEDLSAMRDTWETLETEKSQLATRLDALRAETSSIIEDLKKRADEAEAEKEELTRQLEKIKSELEQSEAEKEQEESKKAEVERLQEQVRDLETRLKESIDGAEVFKKDRDGLNTKIEELNTEVSLLNERLETAVAQVEEISAEKVGNALTGVSYHFLLDQDLRRAGRGREQEEQPRDDSRRLTRAVGPTPG